MKHPNIAGLALSIGMIFLVIGCTPPAYKSMDIAAYNQNTHQWKFDYNLFPLNPNWQYKLVNHTAPWTGNQCPLSDNPADWKSSRTCTSQDLHFNNGQIGCTNVFNRHGGHMNWFPVTDVGIVNFQDHSSDDDYNFYLQNPDSSLYLGSDDPDPMNQNLALEFDSDEFPDPVDDDYNIWWNRFHNAVDDGDDGDFSKAQAMVANKLAIVTGMAGIDIGHDASNTWTSELHPVFGMFILTDEQTSVNPDGSVDMADTWSFFIRNKGNEGWCGTGTENGGKQQLNVFVPEMPYYYAGTITPYPADARDNVTVDDRNVHITNWNGITDNNDPRRERWTKQQVNGGVILNFNFDSEASDGIFVGDLIMNWNIHISFNGFENLRAAKNFIDEMKFKDRFKAMYAANRNLNREFETKDDSLLSLRLHKLTAPERETLRQGLMGKIIIPGMPKLEPIPKGRGTAIEATFAGKDSINIQQFNARVKKMKIGEMASKYRKPTVAVTSSQEQYIQRKLSKQAYIEAYLKSKQL